MGLKKVAAPRLEIAASSFSQAAASLILVVFQRFVRWQLAPILFIGLANVLVTYCPLEGCGHSPEWLSVLFVVAVVAGAYTLDGLLWFTALSLSIPALMARTRQHGALVDCLWLGFAHPILWLYFVVNFTPIYMAYAIIARFGMIAREAVAGFKAGYSGIALKKTFPTPIQTPAAHAPTQSRHTACPHSYK